MMTCDAQSLLATPGFRAGLLNVGLRFATLAAASLAALTFVSPAAYAQSGSADDTALLERGAYLAKAGDCIACHSAPRGKPFAGGLPIATPLGTIYSTNITPSQSAGIGGYTEEQFAAAVRDGRRADGAHLYPAMPYTSYAKITDDDMHALYVWFMKGVTPVDSTPPVTQLPFPFNIRLSMMAWNMLFLDSKRFGPDPGKSVEWNRGAYLVEGLAHCSTCHSPRNALMAETESAALSGGQVGGWFAPNITSDVNSGIGNWSVEDIAAYLKSGVAPGKAQAAGPMGEAVERSFQHLSDADLKAMAVYLKTVAPISNRADTQPRDTWGGPIAEPDAARLIPWPASRDQLTGMQLYDANCASCHDANGQGSADGGLPSLFHNTALGSENANNVVMTVLHGVSHPGNKAGEGAGVDMPGFAGSLSDTEVATLTNFLMQQFGRPGGQVSVADVTSLREGTVSSPLLGVVRGALVAGSIIVLVVVVLVVAAMRRRRGRSTT